MSKLKSGPINPLKVPRFGGIATFSRLPYVPEIKGLDVDVAILGIPYDGGTTFRPGARFGPRAIREASCLNRNYNLSLDTDIFESLRVVDVGDVEVNPLSIPKTLKAIQSRETEIHKKGAKIISLGGDHLLMLAELRALHKKYGKKLCVVQFDAHTDTADEAWGEPYHHGTPVRRAIEEGLVKGENIFQIGIRGPLTSKSQMKFCKDHGINILDMDQFDNPTNRKSFLNHLKQSIGKSPCYVTFDVDGVDPAFAPGTGTPVVGGLTSREALTTLRSLIGLNVVGGSIVEVSPTYDHAQLTSLLASAVAFEIMSLMA